jgi:Tol biopolymer transport system component
LTSRRDASVSRSAVALAAFALVAVMLAGSVAWAATAKTVRVSVKSDGTEVNADNDLPVISADGRYVAFQSVGQFTTGDSGTDGDVFVHDRLTGKTRRASVKSNGTEVNTVDGSEEASISADGRYVAFASDAALTNGDKNGAVDVFVHDFNTGKTKRVSLTSQGKERAADSESPSISADGRYVAFQSDGAFRIGDGNGKIDVYVRDRRTGKTRRASLRAGNGQPTEDSTEPAISGDGSRVAFMTSDGQMTAQPDYGPSPLLDDDVFVRDMKTRTTVRASVTSTGKEADPSNQVPSRFPAISANGRYVSFSSDGRYGLGDTNVYQDVFVRDLSKNRTRLMSVAANGTAGNNDSGVAAPAPLSASGRYVAFESLADLVASDGNMQRDVYMRDRKTGTTTRISVTSGGGAVAANHQEPAISGDGRFVAFASLGAFTGNDSGNDFDVFERGPLQ